MSAAGWAGRHLETQRWRAAYNALIPLLKVYAESWEAHG